MELNKIILYKKSDCPYCLELDTFIPTILNEIGLNISFESIDIDTLPTDVSNKYSVQGIPKVEFYNESNQNIYNMLGKPELNYDEVKKDFANIDSITDEDKLNLNMIILKEVFITELTNATAITLHDNPAQLQENCKKVFENVLPYVTSRMDILNKYK